MRDIQIGDYVFIHLEDGLDPRSFGGCVRVGTVTELGEDALFLGEDVIGLDDGGPRIYGGHIRAISNYGRERTTV